MKFLLLKTTSKFFLTIIISVSILSNVVRAKPPMDDPPAELSWETYDEISNYASQAAEEKLYLEVDWKNSVLDAQREAFEKDRPIVMILFFGDHRSNC